MTPLERRYRRVLGLLPSSYREVWAEDMVSTYLDSVAPDDREDAEYAAEYGRPHWTEVASIAALAVRLRIGSAGAPPRYAAWSEVIRLVVLVGALVHAAANTLGLALTLWMAGMLPLFATPAMLEVEPESWQQVSMVAAVAGALWIPAYFALVLGRWTAGRWLVAVAAAATILSGIARAVVTGQSFSVEFTYNVLINVLLALALLAFHRGAAPVLRGSWLTAFGLCTVLIAGYTLLAFRSMPLLAPLDWAGLWCVVVVAAAAVHLTARALGWLGRFSAWTPALAVLAYAVLGMRLASLLDFARFGFTGWHPATIPLDIAEVVAVLAIAIWMSRLSARALRRLPTKAADMTAWSTPTW